MKCVFINITYFELIVAPTSEVPPAAEEQPEQDVLDRGKNNESMKMLL